MSARINQTLESQTNGHYFDSERIVDGESQNQVKEISVDDKIRKAIGSAVLTVKNWMDDAILTTMDIVLIPRLEMSVKLVTGS